MKPDFITDKIISSGNRRRAQNRPLTKLRKRLKMKRFYENNQDIKELSVDSLFNYIILKSNIDNLLRSLEDVVIDDDQKIFYVYFVKDTLDYGLLDKFLNDMMVKFKQRLTLESDSRVIIVLSQKEMFAVPQDGELVSLSDEATAEETPEEDQEDESDWSDTGVGKGNELSKDSEDKGEETSEEPTSEENEESPPSGGKSESAMKRICNSCKSTYNLIDNLTESLKIKCPKCGEIFDIRFVTDTEDIPQVVANPSEVIVKGEEQDTTEETNETATVGMTPTCKPTPKKKEDGTDVEKPGLSTQFSYLKAQECINCNTTFVINSSEKLHESCPVCDSVSLLDKSEAETESIIIGKLQNGSLDLESILPKNL